MRLICRSVKNVLTSTTPPLPVREFDATYWLIFDWILQGNCQFGADVNPRSYADQFRASMGTVRNALEWLTPK